MKQILLPIGFVFFISCVQPVRMIQDTVKQSTIFQWQTAKYSKSKKAGYYRKFYFWVSKDMDHPDSIYFYVTSDFPITQSDYQDSSYIVLPDMHISMYLSHTMDNIQYKENINTFHTTTTTNSAVSVESSTKVHPVVVSSGLSNRTENQEVKDTKTTTRTDVHTSVNAEQSIIDKTSSKRYSAIYPITLLKVLEQEKFTFRLYNQENDFWDIPFFREEVLQIKKVIRSKGSVARH